MPNAIDVSNPRFSAAFNAREWSGVELFRRADLDPDEGVTMPEFAAGEGEYADALAFLNAFGAGASLGARLTAAWVSLGGVGSFDVTINANDRVSIEADILLGQSFTLTSTPTLTRLGWPATTAAAAAGTYTAPSEWTRGLVRNGVGVGPPTIRLGRVGWGSTVIQLPWAQDVRCLVRGSDAEDVDTPAHLSLTQIDRLFFDEDIVWGVTDDGFVFWCGVGEFEPLTWISATFRDRLGFTGAESVVYENVGQQISYCIAAKRLPGFVAPSRPLIRCDRLVEGAGDALRLADGSYTTSDHGTFRAWEIEARIDGPLDVGGDQTHGWGELVGKWAKVAKPLTVYQDGDSRRFRHPADVSVDAPAYDINYSSQLYAGRLVGWTHPDTGRRFAMTWDSRYRMRAPAGLVLADRTGG